MSTLEQRIHHSLSDELLMQWEQLSCEIPTATPFQTAGWIQAHLASFPPSKLRVAEFRSGEATVGIIPTTARHTRRHVRKIDWLEVAGADYSDYCCPLIHPEHVTEVANEFLLPLVKDARWKAIYFGNFAHGNRFPEELAITAKSVGLHASVKSLHVVRRLSREMFSELSRSGTSWSSDKQLKKLKKQGELEFEVVQDGTVISKLLPQYVEMNRRSFAARGFESAFEDPRQEIFFQNIVKFMASKGRVWLSILHCGGMPVAMRFSLIHNGALHLYSTCYNHEFSSVSPSTHQLRFLLEYAFANGVEVVDFGIGDSPHKAVTGANTAGALKVVEVHRGWRGAAETWMFDMSRQYRKRFPIVEGVGRALRKVFPFGG